MRRFYTSLAAAVALLVVSTAMAQNQNLQNYRGQNQAQGQGQGAGQIGGQAQAGGNLSDMQIAAWLLVGNHEEIVLSQFGEQHAHSQKVKDLAREFEQKHTQLAEQLMHFAGPLASPDMAQAGAAGQGSQNPQAGAVGAPNQAGQQFGQQAAGQQAAGQQFAGQQPGVPGQAGTPGQPGVAGQPAAGNFQTLTSATTGQPGIAQGLNFTMVLQQIGQQCEQSTTQDLGKEQGAKFDKCFVGQQIGAHMGMLAKLRVLKQYASPQLQQILAQGEQTTEHHLQQLKDEMKNLESKHS